MPSVILAQRQQRGLGGGQRRVATSLVECSNWVSHYGILLAAAGKLPATIDSKSESVMAKRKVK